jgi:adenylate kinase family enzyme
MSGMDTSNSGVVLLLGAPGVGKSTLGKLLQRTHASTVDAFNVGDQLRATGKVERHLRDPTAAGKLELSDLASDILDDAFSAFKARMVQHK